MEKNFKTALAMIVACGFVIVGAGCASYVTPGAGVDLARLGDADIKELMANEPAAKFPANVAVARIQAPNYHSYRNESYGTGRYSVVTTRDVETEEDFHSIAALPMVAGVAPMNRLLLPAQLDTVKALRTAAARLKADILLVYTFDTTFRVGAQKYRPLNVIALGFLNNKEVIVTTTASAAMFDVRTEFLYGLAEASARESKSASVWSSSDTVDDLRVVTERKAFELLLPEIQKTWAGVVKTHAGASSAKESALNPRLLPAPNLRA
jgi:hypothetical protein